WYVRFVPKAAVSNRSKAAWLFDHLVGAGEQRGRNFEAERPGRLEVDHQLEFGRLHDRQVSRLRPFENSAGVDTSEAPSVRAAGAVADQGAGRDQLTVSINCRDAMPCRQCNELPTGLEKERVLANKQRPGAVPNDRSKGCFEIAIARR